MPAAYRATDAAVPLISIVAPVFNERACLEEFHRRVTAAMTAISGPYEIVFVDDGSADGSWEVIEELAAADSRVRGVRFSRNFGHHISITAGLDHARGAWIVVMDSDLQDPPEAIPALYAEAARGFDHVIGCRATRDDPWLKRSAAHLFYRVYAWLTESTYELQAGVFRIMSRRMVAELRGMREAGRFFPGMADWVGFRRSTILVHHDARYAGDTKYPLHKQLALALTTILSFSDKPLLLVMYAGLAMALLSLSYSAVVVVRWLLGQIVVSGYASIASAIFFVGGFTIFSIGIVGIYVGRIFKQVQGRPLYIVSESTADAADEVEGGGKPHRHETRSYV